MIFIKNKKMLKTRKKLQTKDRIQIDYDDAKDEIAAVILFFVSTRNSTCVPGEVIDSM